MAAVGSYAFFHIEQMLDVCFEKLFLSSPGKQAYAMPILQVAENGVRPAERTDVLHEMRRYRRHDSGVIAARAQAGRMRPFPFLAIISELC